MATDIIQFFSWPFFQFYGKQNQFELNSEQTIFNTGQHYIINSSNIIMLTIRSLLRPIAHFHKTAKQSLHSQLGLLSKKLHKQNQQNQKLLLLAQLNKNNRLQQYFSQKQIKDFCIEDAYFYLTNKDKFQHPGHSVYTAMITSTQMQCFARFSIAEQTGMYRNAELQKKLIQYFNESCISLSDEDFVQCARVMGMFDKAVVKDMVNTEAVVAKIRNSEAALLKKDKIELEADGYFLGVLYHLRELDMLKDMGDMGDTRACVGRISEEMLKGNATIKFLYFLDSIEPTLAIKPTTNQLKLRQKHLQKRIILAKTPQQLHYTLLILQTYLQFIYLIKVEQLNSPLYIKYLQLIQKHSKQNESFSIPSHLVPNNAIATCTEREFLQFMRLRDEMELEGGEDVEKFTKRIIGHNFDGLKAMLRYLVEQHADNNKNWMQFEKAFLQKLHLNSKQRDIHRMAKDHGIPSITRTLGYMSSHKLGSTTFWKPCHHLIFDIMMDNNLIKKIGQEEQNSFIISIYQIYIQRTIPEPVEERLRNLSIVTLVNNDWDINQLYQLVKCLTVSKYGPADIWYAIENKILAYPINKFGGQHIRLKMAMILEYFRQMNVGSYKYYEHMKKNGIGAPSEEDPLQAGIKKESLRMEDRYQFQELQN